MIKILNGDCRDVLKTLPDCSVHCCVTSRDVLALANGIYSAHHGMDAAGNPYATGASARHWLRGWRLLAGMENNNKFGRYLHEFTIEHALQQLA